MRRVLLTAVLLALPSAAWASGCYICGSDSAPACRDYCQYTGADTFDNRRRCEAKGCRIGGTAACPGPGSGARICQAPAISDEKIAWCVAPTPPPGA
jgi:hypothetical protein